MSALSDVAKVVAAELATAGLKAAFELARTNDADAALFAAQEHLADARARAKHTDFRADEG